VVVKWLEVLLNRRTEDLGSGGGDAKEDTLGKEGMEAEEEEDDDDDEDDV